MPHHKSSTLVLGASGLVGSAVAKSLAQAGVPVKAAFRTRPIQIPGANPVRVDAQTGEGIQEAFRGVNQLFLMMGDLPDQTDVELRLVEAAPLGGSLPAGNARLGRRWLASHIQEPSQDAM